MSGVEQRQSNRTRSFLRGEIVHSNGASRTDCTVRDISDTGARLEIPVSVTLPEFFEILVPLKSITRRARIIWRHNNEIGISFVHEAQAGMTATSPIPLSGDTFDLRRRVLDLEAETMHLRSQLAEMRQVIAALNQQRKIA
ncbi:MAG: PilZ domain-containing protein [Proteobacteria bacterium]|nr:PilZ domain-containing protein [Pseudomonadota bacterium]